MTEPRYQLAVTLDQLSDLQTMLETVSSRETDPDAEVFRLLDLVRKTRVDAIKFKQRNQDRGAEILARLAAKHWRTSNQGRPGGVVLVWDGAVYGWKNSLRDAAQERPGAYAVDEDESVFIADGGDDDNGAKCWVVVNPARP